MKLLRRPSRKSTLLLIFSLLFISASIDVMATAQLAYPDLIEDIGYLDPTFGQEGVVITPVGNYIDYSHAVAIQDDGKLVVIGHFGKPSSNDFFVIRFNTDGSFDTSFGNNGKATIDFGLYDQAMHVVIQDDGKIVVASNSQSGNLNPNAFAIARLNPDGSLDSRFDGDGKRVDEIRGSHDVITELALQDDGKIIAGGYSYANYGLGLRADFAMVRYNPDGSLDSSFGTNGIVITSRGGDYDGSFSTLLQPDGKIILAGFSNYSCSVRDCLALMRYNSDGSLDTSFGVEGIVEEDFGVSFIIFSSVLLPDGKIVSSGYSSAGEGIMLTRHNPDGSLDTTFGTNGLVIKNFGDINLERTEGMALQPDGKLLISGFYGGDVFLLRYNSDGTPDTSFCNDGVIYHSIGDGDDRARYVALQEDGKIVVTGDTFTGSNYDIFVARYLNTCSLPPTADAGGPYYGDEGTPIELVGATTTDPDGDTLTYSWSINSPDCTFSDPNVLNPTLTCKDNGNYTVTLTVSDGVNDPVSSSADVQIANLPPEDCIIEAPIDPVAVGIEISTTVSFTDPGVLDTHTVAWDWGDTLTSDGIVIESNGSGSAAGNHTYTSPGVYTIGATVIDKDGDVCSPIFQYIVVYDPDGGFVTGGGWIDSPEGAYAADPSLTGKANFGFVSKYKKGATAPTGNTEFQFHAGDLNFHSSEYEWLVVTGSDYARFKGTGTINGEGEYKFMIWAGDDYQDTFRIKIWEEVDDVEIVIYDNGMDQPIEGGNIVVHAK
jgi:uncharacterized delta-60 repeat protein